MTSTHYLWDYANDSYLAETDDSGTATAVHTVEPDQYGRVASQRRGGMSSYFEYDGLHSTRQLTNTSGTSTDAYLYDAFGTPASTSGGTLTPFRWEGESGYYWDAELGSYYVRARSYQPSIARWMSADPLRTESSNLYVYCDSQPLSLVDSSGEAPAAKPSVTPIPRPKPAPGIPPGWTPTAWPVPGKPPAPAGCSAPAVPPLGFGLPPTVLSCIGYWSACRAGNALACNGFWACMNGGADPANSCVRACLQTVGFPPPATPPGPLPPSAGFPATSPNCWCNYLQHLACFTACRPRAPGVSVPPWSLGGAGFNWCAFEGACSANVTPVLNTTPWTTYSVPPCRWPTAPTPIGGPTGSCLLY